MASLIWTAESGAESATVTTGNSGGTSGDAWDAVTIGANATAVYDSTVTAVGKRSLRLATGASAVTAFVQWLVKIGQRWPSGMTTQYGRTYFRVASIPAADRTVLEFLAPDGVTNRGNLRLRSTGALRIRDAANATVATTTTILSPNTWYRIEERLDGSVTGNWEIRLYLGSSAVALETLSGSANFGGVIGAINLGYVAAVAALPQIWFDAVEFNDTGFPGPASYGSLCPGRWHGPWAGAGNIPASRLADDFADNSVNTTLWSQFAFGSVTGSETAGTYQFAVTTAGTGAAQLLTQSRYDLTGDYFATELTSAGAQEAGLQAYATMAQVDASNQAYVTVANGFMGAVQNVAGVITGLNFIAYDPALHRWFRIREAAGTTYWEVSANGVVWSAIWSAANPIPLNDVTLLIGTDTYLTLGGAKTVTFGQVSAPVLP